MMAAQPGIVIAGGAFAGLALALALRQGLGEAVPVIVADPALASRPSRGCARRAEPRACTVGKPVSLSYNPLTSLVSRKVR